MEFLLSGRTLETVYRSERELPLWWMRLLICLFMSVLIVVTGSLETAGEVYCALESEDVSLIWPKMNSTHNVAAQFWKKDQKTIVATSPNGKDFNEGPNYTDRLMRIKDIGIKIKGVTKLDSGAYVQYSRFEDENIPLEALVYLLVTDAPASVCKPWISHDGLSLKAQLPSDDVCATLTLEWKDANKTVITQNGTAILELGTDSGGKEFIVCAVGGTAKCFQGNFSDFCINHIPVLHHQQGDNGVTPQPAVIAVPIIVIFIMVIIVVIICWKRNGCKGVIHKRSSTVITGQQDLELPLIQNAELSQIKDYLRTLYKGMTYIPVSPVGEGTNVNVSELYINLDLEQIAARDTKYTKSDLPKEDAVTVKKQNKQLPPIMIFGDSGSGKSTWCKYLVQCWSQNSKMGDVEVQCLNLPDLRKFQIILYLPLKMSHQRLSFQELLQDCLFPDKQSYLEFVIKYMDEQDDFQSVLIVIDGLDKIEKKASLRLISELLNQKPLSSCAFILTSQPSIFKLIFDRGIDRSMKLFKIRELTLEKSISYAKNILSIKNHQNNTDFSVDNFLTFAKYLNAMCLLESPYHCLTLLFVWMENSDPNIEITDILLHILENLLKRAMKGESCKENISKILQGSTYHKASIEKLLNKHQLILSFVCSLSGIADELFQSERKIQTCAEWLCQKDLATVACELGLITESLSLESSENLPKLSFTNRLIYAFLVSIATELNKGPTFDYIVSDMDIALQNALIIHMLCQLSPSRGNEIFNAVGKQMEKRDESQNELNRKYCIKHMHLGRSGHREESVGWLQSLMYKSELDDEKLLFLTNALRFTPSLTVLELENYENNEDLIFWLPFSNTLETLTLNINNCTLLLCQEWNNLKAIKLRKVNIEQAMLKNQNTKDVILMLYAINSSWDWH